MAVGAFTVVNDALERILNGTVDLDSDTFYAALITEAHTAAVTNSTWADISASHASGTNYSPVDQSLTVAEAAGVVTVDSNDANFGNNVTVEAKYCYILAGDEAAPAAGDAIIGYVDLDDSSGTATISSTSGDFVVSWNASGLFTVQRQ
ncbi:hypothetical protein [Roseibium aggregatum]|uniref:Uncharacterized protein n=1 Tax=Roseibium aggregatum TaxID=187304 RepID=A0A0M6Y7S1_9HYPH|nr:hypothetical protein [Roseibium aggregatum]CTQ45764.1 hypothetical protein LAL4801_04219 [Roseibium aggregatum]